MSRDRSESAVEVVDPVTGEVFVVECDEKGRPVRAVLSSDGRREINDPVPLEPAVQLRSSRSMERMMREFVRQELSDRAEEAGFESESEANDFDVEDDPVEPLTAHELALLDPAELQKELDKYRPVRVPVESKKDRAPEDATSSATPVSENSVAPEPQATVKRSESEKR